MTPQRVIVSDKGSRAPGVVLACASGVAGQGSHSCARL